MDNKTTTLPEQSSPGPDTVSVNSPAPRSRLKKYWWLGALLLAIILITLVILEIKPKAPGDDIKKPVTGQDNGNATPEPIGPVIDPDNPPRFIQADFVELDKVYMISKFRSGMGHDYSHASDETCRSMKHYFTSMDPSQPDNKSIAGNNPNAMPAPSLDKDVKIFSPVDGTLRFVDFDDVVYNHELSIIPDGYPNVNIRLMHVQNAPGVVEGHVTAGQLVGLVLANQSFDLAIDLGMSGAYKIDYISYFAAMPESVFAKYQARGVQSRDDLIITKAYRDAHPFSCHGKEVFDENYGPDDLPGNAVFLSGYEEVNAALQAKSR